MRGRSVEMPYLLEADRAVQSRRSARRSHPRTTSPSERSPRSARASRRRSRRPARTRRRRRSGSAAEERVVREPRVLDRIDELGPDLVVALLVLGLGSRPDLEGEADAIQAWAPVVGIGTGIVCSRLRQRNDQFPGGGEMATSEETRLEYSPALGRRIRLGQLGGPEDLDLPEDPRGDRAGALGRRGGARRTTSSTRRRSASRSTGSGSPT